MRIKYETVAKTDQGNYENAWTYQGSTFSSDDINSFFDFVYRITNLQSGKQYIGRKYFWQKRKPSNGKRRVTSESNWKKYYGSSDELKSDVKLLGRESFKREILSLHESLGKVTTKRLSNYF